MFLITLLIHAVFLASCQEHSMSNNENLINQKQVIFFTDENQVAKEASYYDALIELKREFPVAFQDLLVITPQTEDTIPLSDVKYAYPTLIVMEDNEVVCIIEGQTNKEEIIHPVSKALENW